jgi:PAS domain S-box-containing protein
VDLDKDSFEAIAPDAEPGMNLISVDFDLVMVNRANERLYAKPMVALLGNKCYREFEKRDEPCPHCPGRLALATGEPHEAETVGVRDDGTRFAARIRAHPVIGPDDQPTGFIEVVEDITEQKRAESIAQIDADLQTALTAVQNVPRALREALRAALLVEGIDLGAVYQIDQASREHQLVQMHGVSSGLLDLFADISRGAPFRADDPRAGNLRALAVVPILHRGSTMATLLAGTSIYPDIPASLRAGLHTLGTTTGNAISRILAERCRGDAIADLEALIAVSPVATWVIDCRGRIKVWNRAAETVFGWRAAEVMGRRPPWYEGADLDPVGPASPGTTRETVLVNKDGGAVPVRLSIAPFRDVVGNDSSLVVMAQDLTTERRVAELEAALEGLAGRSSAADTGETNRRRVDAQGTPRPTEQEGARVLVIDGGEGWGKELAAVLSGLGHIPVRCASVQEAAALLEQADAATSYSLAVVALLGPGGYSGLRTAAALRSLGPTLSVALSSDVDVQGYEQHGVAAVIKRPYRPEAVAQALRAALAGTGASPR